MADLKIDYPELDIALQEAADENSLVRAGALRRVNRKLYDRLARDGFDWRGYARSKGYQTKTRVPRGHWNRRRTLIEIIREVARDKGAPITRGDLVRYGYGSANPYIDAIFGGFANACEAAGVQQSAKSGRADHWIYDDDLVKEAFRKHVQGDVAPTAAGMRRKDSAFEALLRERFGSYVEGAAAFGFKVPEARKTWSDETVMRGYRRYYAPITERDGTMGDFDLDGYSKWLRAAQNRFGSLRRVRELNNDLEPGYMTAYGFRVDSQGEARVAMILHMLGADAQRHLVKLSDETYVAPDFTVQRSDGTTVFVEVLMIDDWTSPSTNKEMDYQRRWAHKHAKMLAHGLPVVTIGPVILRDHEALIGLIQKSVLSDEASPSIGAVAATLTLHSPVQWTIEKMREEIQRVGRMLGRTPSQSDLRRVGKPGIVNAIYRRGYNMRWVHSRMKRSC